MKRYNARHPFNSLSEILHNRGYYNLFVYGGDLVFDNVEGFFTLKKYDKFYGEESLGTEYSFSKWGIPDHILFEKTTAIIDSLPRPFLLTMQTLSNHEPFDLPDSSVQRFFEDDLTSKMFNSQLYADHALGHFIDLIREKGVSDSTIFVFTADHTRFDAGRFYLDPMYFHIPLLIYSPALLGTEGRVIEKYGGQTDILPTLMGLLGGDYTHSSWGRDLLKLDDNDSGYAIMNVLRRIGYIDPRFFYYEDLGVTWAMVRTDQLHTRGVDVTYEQLDECLTIRRRLHRYMQIADQLSTPAVK
jgi:phosphoglycerol transferase MdoB-like AlkP superfamily enzyme